MSGRHSIGFTSLAGVFGHWGKRSEAGALHRELLDRASRNYVPASHLTLPAEAAGRREEALAFARRAGDEREPPFILPPRPFAEAPTLHSEPQHTEVLPEMES